MPRIKKSDRRKEIAELEELYQKGQLTKDTYLAILKSLGLDSAAVFDQKKQSVEQQINIAKLVQVAPEPGTDPAGLRQAYLNRIYKQTCRLPLSGVDPKAASASEEGIRELQLSAVYTALMTQRPEEDSGQQGRRLQPREAGPAQRLSALAVLNRERYLALLGDPGSGKSTFANFVALCLAGEALGEGSANLDVLRAPLPPEERGADEEKKPKRQPWKHGALLPVCIVLRELAARGLPDPGKPADGGTLWKFIEAELGATLQEFAPHLKKTLQKEGGLILLDGLDEVPDANQRRLQVKEAVQGFVEDFPRCRFLVTSRTYAYQRQEWKLDGFSEAVLTPFTAGQIERFVDRWYAHMAAVHRMDPEDAQGRAVVLKTAIERNPRLAELAARPLLLTLMASLHAWRGGSLPEKREELYADAVDLLLDQWEGSKVVLDASGVPLVRQESLAEYLKVDRAVIRKSLNRLAFEAHRDQPQLTGTADIFQDKLVGMLMGVSRNPDLKPVRLVEYIHNRAGLLAAKGEGVFTFPHRTFQEYLAACHLTDFNFPGEAVSLLKADPQRWREALLLAGAKAAHGTSSAVWNLAEALCFKKPPPKSAKKGVDPECWAALLAAQALLENEGERRGEVAEYNAPKLERIRLWLRAIVEQGRLPAVDRVLAGEALAVFGDDRDFDELVPVPAGPFVMGDDEDEDARPRHEVLLPAFKIGRYPVTNGQYRRFIESAGWEWGFESGLLPERANCPAAEMTWHDAKAFCEWLTNEWLRQGKIRADEIVRLPTEAEWEKAARGTDGLTFPWGSDWDKDKCNTYESGLGRTSAVGMYPAGVSPYGCLDMAGNVWEWTSSLWGKDWQKPDFKYPYRPDDGRENLEAGDEILRVLRGGSWSSYQYLARCAYRLRDFPSDRSGNFGFRVVVSPVSHPSAL
jgi:formylglycine-generating enzyme required for sulfatase activity